MKKITFGFLGLFLSLSTNQYTFAAAENEHRNTWLGEQLIMAVEITDKKEIIMDYTSSWFLPRMSYENMLEICLDALRNHHTK